MKFISFLSAVILMFSTQLNGHCQIPCGVYDDAMRVKMIEEHTLTILKSMNYTLRICSILLEIIDISSPPSIS